MVDYSQLLLPAITSIITTLAILQIQNRKNDCTFIRSYSMKDIEYAKNDMKKVSIECLLGLFLIITLMNIIKLIY